MKKVLFHLVILFSLFLFSSCGIPTFMNISSNVSNDSFSINKNSSDDAALNEYLKVRLMLLYTISEDDDSPATKYSSLNTAFRNQYNPNKYSAIGCGNRGELGVLSASVDGQNLYQFKVVDNVDNVNYSATNYAPYYLYKFEDPLASYSFSYKIVKDENIDGVYIRFTIKNENNEEEKSFILSRNNGLPFDKTIEGKEYHIYVTPVIYFENEDFSNSVLNLPSDMVLVN